MAVLVTIRLVGGKVWDGEGWIIRCRGETSKCKDRDGLHDKAVEVDGTRTKKTKTDSRYYL